jgi:hypothetical protein
MEKLDELIKTMKDFAEELAKAEPKSKVPAKHLPKPTVGKPASHPPIDPMDHPSTIRPQEVGKLLKEEEEVLKVAANGQWALEKGRKMGPHSSYFKEPVNVSGTPLSIKHRGGQNYSVHDAGGTKVGSYKIHPTTYKVSGSLDGAHKQHHTSVANKVGLLHGEMEQHIHDENNDK